ncbi:hypothetical protein [Bradyrhizobium symbiodeficiens]|uniref:hypothetical protein n=1 Tax=Bradyrhizobium symbiodeficiens TaxID=1404367 RepID=UPI000BA1B80C|nr:hypothetical protein [Bradyrhizobium symbiodeficiens]AWM07719.1 hypothetical protein CIT39_15540 [Bradyrhizobium symbiodeficiens]
MQTGFEGELDAIADAARAMRFAWEHGQDKETIAKVAHMLATRQNSPLAQATGAAIVTFLKQKNIIT